MSNITSILKRINEESKNGSIESYLNEYRAHELQISMFHKKKEKEYNIGDRKVSHQDLINIFIKKIESSGLDPDQEKKGLNLTKAFFFKNEISSESVAEYQKLLGDVVNNEDAESTSIGMPDRPKINKPIKNIHSQKIAPRNLWDKK